VNCRPRHISEVLVDWRETLPAPDVLSALGSTTRRTKKVKHARQLSLLDEPKRAVREVDLTKYGPPW
jgi:hypothetical protein